MSRRAPPEISSATKWLLRGFQRYNKAYLRRSFHAVRLLGDCPPVEPERPLVVYLNHPSWWDPLICLLLSERCCGNRENYAPIDAAMLSRYAFMKRLGFFGVEPGTHRGGAQFLRSGEAILSRRRSSLWLTPQGRFADPRERPVQLAPGLAHLTRRVPEAVCVPLALEYPFWSERKPEALAHFGAVAEPDRLAAAMEAAQDTLGAAAVRRNPHEFVSLLDGTSGEGGIYELWRRIRSLWRGERFRRAHIADDRNSV